MKAMKLPHLGAAALAFAICASGVMAQAQKAAPAAKAFEPQVGQAGKDVIWVPTSQALVDAMMKIGKVTARDVLFDLGSGDGRTVITAAKIGARAYGIEYNPDMVELSKQNAAKAGVTERATFTKADLFETDFSQANVITMFLLSSINLKLRPKILDLKPGTRIVSNSFTMDNWKEDESVNVTEGCTNYCTAYFWLVPAKVGGNWSLGKSQLSLKQEFQMVSGTLTAEGNTVPVSGRLRGEQLSFTADGAQYEARVNGSAMEGTRKAAGSSSAFSAARK
ncbi:MAG: class I SAM-dependent methyltransferase [Betaproteobacteria bacterium]|nr:class I SAM-dependent methyltransferase [Betaproteobacteria bacterium]